MYNVTLKDRNYRTLATGGFGTDVEFIANVIYCQMPKAGTKLLNMVDAIARGIEIRSGNTIETIRINGQQFPISILDKYVRV